jgi:hypothetical protein
MAANELYAGTDANVRLALTGAKGDSGKLRLDRSDHANKFEQGQVRAPGSIGALIPISSSLIPISSTRS